MPIGGDLVTAAGTSKVDLFAALHACSPAETIMRRSAPMWNLSTDRDPLCHSGKRHAPPGDRPGVAEEIGILSTPDALIERRVWPAHGMVVDQGLNALHWTHQQAVAYLMSTGQYTTSPRIWLADEVFGRPSTEVTLARGVLRV